MITRVVAVVAATAILIGGASVPAQEAPAAEVDAEAAALEEGAKLFRARTCFTCHGADAKTPILPNYPKLAGQNYEYVLQQITDIKSGARSNGMSAAMKGITHLVSEPEIELLARYISSLEP